MEDRLNDLEYYSSIHHCYVIGDIIDIDDEENYIMKNRNDSTEEICEAKNIRKITNITSTPINEGNECICEYMKNDEEFLEVEIKEKKGLFYILEIEDEEGNQSTILSRQKQLRYIEYVPIEDFIQEKYVNVIIDMPTELSSWIGSERFNDVLKRIKGGEENDNKLFYSYYPSDSPKFLRILCDSEKRELAKLMLTTAMEKEKQLTSLNQDTENRKKQLEDAQKRNKSVYINQKFVGLIIGKEGSNIKNLKSKYGVNITIAPKKDKNDKKPTKVIITGENGENVEECAKEINVCEKIFEIPESSVGDLKKRANKLIEDYKVKHFFISNEEKKDDEGVTYKAPNVSIIGNSEYIDDLYNNEIKDYDSYKTSNNNYNYSSGTYRKSSKRYNNYYNNYQDSYNYKGYNNYNSYYK